jgi:hypothetical protein
VAKFFASGGEIREWKTGLRLPGQGEICDVIIEKKLLEKVFRTG